jgi:hypothetical protein
MLTNCNVDGAENIAISQQSCGSQIALLGVERDGARSSRSEFGGPPIVSPVMNRCLYYLRGPCLPHGGVGGANSMSQRWRRLALFAPTPRGTDTAVLPV